MIEFGPLVIAYDDRVLEPRPWTAMQSEWAAELAPALPSGPILELFAGAGHIGLLAARLSGRSLVQVEADAVAAEFARHNAVTAGLADRVEIRVARVEDALTDAERYPLVVADPPYLPTRDVGLFPDDPVSAIDGGPDGLDVVRTAIDVVAAHMTADGACLLQLAGPDQVRAVEAFVAAHVPQLTVAGCRSVDERRSVALLTAR